MNGLENFSTTLAPTDATDAAVTFKVGDADGALVGNSEYMVLTHGYNVAELM
jgi:hypothetical protein